MSQMDAFGLCGAIGMQRCPGRHGEVCRCDLPSDHEGQQHRCGACGETFLPAPPTGPPIEVPNHKQNQFSRYRHWLKSEDGLAVWRAAVADLDAALSRGEARWSPRDFASRFRTASRVAINNTFTAWLADDLILLRPEAEHVIERRLRKKAKV